jgi:hypothetical protein
MDRQSDIHAAEAEADIDRGQKKPVRQAF